MKRFRFAGLLVIALALVGGAKDSARAFYPIQGYKSCSGVVSSGYCWSTLANCCNWNRQCPDGYEYEWSDCTDGTNYCP
ncbi:MAG TPA: hypothetical protein VG477_19035 [Thermoanaerobaculia bacterium]|nr:hypothetical protein [Thermoanaerobaculia bacterium]